MKLKCKLCGKLLESDEECAIPLNIIAGDEASSKIAEMSNNLLLLMNHLLIEHPEKASEIYLDLNSKLSSMFEIIREEI